MSIAGRPGCVAPPVAVVIVSHERPEHLLACLGALALQTRPADDVIVVLRRQDGATRAALAARAPDAVPCRIVAVDAPGVVAARNAGLDACHTDIVAFCDDDTRPHPDWIERIATHFEQDPQLGGLGGRDRCHDGAGFDERRRAVVGRIQWFGRTIGNHHLGQGAPRDVRFLKGANMSFRRAAAIGLRFDPRLRGQTIQAHEDLAFSMAVRRAGWKLRYDPAVVVDHFPARRQQRRRSYVATRELDDATAYFDQCHNHALALWDELSPARRVAFGAWSLLIGTRAHPGLVQALRLTPGEGAAVWRKLALCQRAHATVFAAMLARRRSTPAAADSAEAA